MPGRVAGLPDRMAGKVQFHARDLTRISATQTLLVGKVCHLKLDLTRLVALTI